MICLFIERKKEILLEERLSQSYHLQDSGTCQCRSLSNHDFLNRAEDTIEISSQLKFINTTIV